MQDKQGQELGEIRDVIMKLQDGSITDLVINLQDADDARVRAEGFSLSWPRPLAVVRP